MKAATGTLILSVIAGTSLLVPAGGSASWWGSNDHDYWDGPWGYPGHYGGWGGYPGYGGWGYPGYGGWGYPGYGGWGGGPRIIYNVPQEASGYAGNRIE